jgi:hypothetical protein
MNEYTYDHEVITMTTMFLNAMSDIVINRFNVHKEVRDKIKTRIVYAPKQRVLNDLLNRDQTLQLPAIAVSIGGISRDPDRVVNKILGTFHTPPNSVSSLHERQPLPINVTYNVSVMTKYQEDMDQILSHILPYVNPYFVVSWRTPIRTEHEIRSTVHWDGNVSMQYPVELMSSNPARVVADMTFTFKGWIFQSAPTEVKNIFVTTSSFTNAIDSKYLLEEFGDLVADRPFIDKQLHALPIITSITPGGTQIINPKPFTITGAHFEDVTNVYLSGHPINHVAVSQTPFSQNVSLSGKFLPFVGTKLSNTLWSYDKQSKLKLKLPDLTGTGRLDIVLEGPAGYSKLTDSLSAITIYPGLPEFALTDKILLETGNEFLLQENGSKIILDKLINT